MPLSAFAPWGWLISKLEQLLRREFEQGKQRAIENAVSAWKTLDPGLLFNALAEYYEERGVTPFAYPGTAQRVPLFVRPEWLHLDERSLVMVYDGVERPVERDKASQRFFDLFSSNAFRADTSTFAYLFTDSRRA